MEATLAVLCDFSSLTREGKLNILGVFHEINPPSLPYSLPTMFLVVSFEASAAEVGQEKQISVILMDSDAQPLLRLESTLRVPKTTRPGRRAQMNAVLGLNGIRFERPGDYAFSIQVGGEEKRSLPLRVNEPLGEGERDAAGGEEDSE